MMDQVMSAALSSQPMSVSRAEKAFSSLRNFVAVARPCKPLKFKRCHCLCCSEFSVNIRNKGMSLLSHQRCLVYALPLQALTTDNGSEGSISPTQSSSVEYASMFQPEEGAQQSLLYYIGVWYTNAKTQNVTESLHQVLEKSKTELQTVDKSQVLQRMKSSKVATFGICWWESSQPWVKWPVAIFIPWFLVISLFYGISASRDLLPLWVVGPLLTGLAVKANVELLESCRQWVVESNLAEVIAFVAEGLKTGQLPGQVVELLGTRFEEMKIKSAKKKEELEDFFGSGEYKRALREHMEKRIFELQEACIDKYKDWQLVYYYIERKLKNII